MARRAAQTLVEWTPNTNSSNAESTRRDTCGVDAAISAIAGANHGTVTTQQLLGLGLSLQQIAYRVAIGRLYEIHRGVYAVGTPQLPRLGNHMAAARACSAPVTHKSSLGMQGVLRDNRTFIEVTAPNRRGRWIDGIKAHAGSLDPDDITEVEGIPCSTVARALLEIAGTEPPYLVRAAVRQAARMEVLDFTAVRASIARVHRPRGARTLREILVNFDPEVLNAANEFEERVYDLCVEHGLPRPRLNRPLTVEGHFCIPDVLFSPERLIVEADGGEHQQPHERVADLERERRLRRAGYRIRRFTWAQVVYEPERTVATIRRLLAAASSGRINKPSL